MDIKNASVYCEHLDRCVSNKASYKRHVRSACIAKWKDLERALNWPTLYKLTSKASHHLKIALGAHKYLDLFKINLSILSLVICLMLILLINTY